MNLMENILKNSGMKLNEKAKNPQALIDRKKKELSPEDFKVFMKKLKKQSKVTKLAKKVHAGQGCHESGGCH